MMEEESTHKEITNLTDILSEQAEIVPEGIAIYSPEGSLSYKDVETLVWRMAIFLNKQNVKPGDVVALTFRNELTLFITMLAVAKIGATAFSVPRDTPKIQHDIVLTRVKVNFLATDIAGDSNILFPTLFMDFKTLVDSQCLIDFNVRVAYPDAPWLYIEGSGSTGKSKIMPVHHRQQIQRMNASLAWLPVTKRDRVATLVHLDHHVSKILYLETLNAGLSIVLFDRKRINPIVLCKRYDIALLHATVFHVHQILRSLPESSANTFASLKVLLIGGSTVPNPLRKKIAKKLTPNLYVRYGINEVGTIAAAHTPEVYTTTGTVGHVLPHISVEIVNANLQRVKQGKVGLIRIKSATTIASYLDDPEANKRAFKDGWFYPGDLGKFTSDGQLIHLGRSDNMMIMAGNNIYPSEIEHCILSHPNVEDAVAMPIRSSMYQDIPVCAVVLRNSVQSTEKELLDYINQHLGFRSPKRIIILDYMPRNEQGKLINAKLIEKIESKL